MARRVVLEILDDEIEEIVPRKRLKDHLDPFSGLSDVEIYNRYRFPAVVVMEIVDLIRDELERPTKRHAALSPVQQVCCALRYLASNSFQEVVGDTMLVSKAASNAAIWRVLKSLMPHFRT